MSLWRFEPTPSQLVGKPRGNTPLHLNLQHWFSVIRYLDNKHPISVNLIS